MDTLVSIHSWFRWVVLVALVAAAAIGLFRAARAAEWNKRAALPYSLAIMILDIQVTIGIVLWIIDGAWNDGLFFAAIHPVGMLIALAVAHVGLARARRMARPASHRLVGGTLIVALLVVILAVPRGAWF